MNFLGKAQVNSCRSLHPFFPFWFILSFNQCFRGGCLLYCLITNGECHLFVPQEVVQRAAISKYRIPSSSPHTCFHHSWRDTNQNFSYLAKKQQVSNERQRWRMSDPHPLQPGVGRNGVPGKRGKYGKKSILYLIVT